MMTTDEHSTQHGFQCGVSMCSIIYSCISIWSYPFQCSKILKPIQKEPSKKSNQIGDVLNFSHCFFISFSLSMSSLCCCIQSVSLGMDLFRLFFCPIKSIHSMFIHDHSSSRFFFVRKNIVQICH